jgi:uncharacterized protein YbjT (DUF2867 family)
MIVITTPTGHIGSQIIPALLASNVKVRVIARSPEKLPREIRARVEVFQGSSEDEAVLDRALAGASSLFHCVPPDFSARDVDEYYLRFTRAAICALKKHGVHRVVTISAVGRRVDVKAGVVTSALRKDIAFEEAGVHVRALWCPGFMENMLMSLETLRTQGGFFGPSRPDVARPYVATKDIAATAARLLLDCTWTGPGGVAVLGPEDLSLDDMAKIMSEVLGRPVRYEQIPADAYKAQLMKYGASEAFAQGLIEMHEAKDRGLDHAVERTPENTSPTSFRTWCSEVLRPALERVIGAS